MNLQRFIICIFLFLGYSHESVSQQVIRLYPGKAPGSENWTWTEQTNTHNLFNTEVVYNVTDPTITAYLPPKEAANGTAVIIAPGGAFHTLSIQSEGIDVAKWLNSQGVAAFVLKYRVARSFTDDPVKELSSKMQDFKALDAENEPIIPLATADGIAAVTYLRKHAAELNIDTDKIGFMGFSAGGTLTMSVVYTAPETGRPNFVAPIYAYEPAILGSQVPQKTTPIFVAVAGDDGLKMMPYSINIYKKWFDAGQPAELHIYEKGNHGFGMRTQNLPVDSWYRRLGDWMKNHGFISAPKVTSGPFQRIPTPNDTLQSVKRIAGDRLQFSIYAPEASQVKVNGDFPGGNLTLNKDAGGVWSAQTPSAAIPDIYTYDFTVDGIRTLDPKNRRVKESNGAYSNLFEVSGPENELQSLKDVPHGKLQQLWYTSESLGGITRRLHVYLPPGYDEWVKTKKLPVLYLLHGGGDNDASWTTAGVAHQILDNLYAEGKLKPMIVVMPAGHTPVAGNSMGAGPEGDPFCRDFTEDIIPFIEKTFPVSSKREDRAIAGLSMGGIQTLNLALWNPELFGYVYPMSTGYFENLIKEIEEKHLDVLKNPSLNEFKRFVLGIGKEDFAYANNQNTMNLLKKNGVKFEYHETDGGHTFLFWRKHLAYLAPQLFR